MIIDNKLSFDMHIAEKVDKASSVVGAIRRSFEYLDKDTFKKLYTVLVRPHLEYANAVFNPYKKKNITIVENVQRRATKMVPGLGDKSYEDTQGFKISNTDLQKNPKGCDKGLQTC